MSYSIILDAIAHLLSFDIVWFAELIMTNLLWVFIFLVAVYLIFDGKHLLSAFLVFAVYIWAFSDIVRMTGWLFAGSLIIFFFFANTFLHFWSDSDEWMYEHSGILVGLLFLSFWAGWYLFSLG